jgi:hypothetical protein
MKGAGSATRVIDRFIRIIEGRQSNNKERRVTERGIMEAGITEREEGSGRVKRGKKIGGRIIQ